MSNLSVYLTAHTRRMYRILLSHLVSAKQASACHSQEQMQVRYKYDNLG